MFRTRAHSALCCHLIDNDTYDLKHHVKVPVKIRNDTSTFNSVSFHRKHSVKCIMNTFHLKTYNYSHRHHSELIVHIDSVLEVRILVGCFISFCYAFLHFDSPIWLCYLKGMLF